MDATTKQNLLQHADKIFDDEEVFQAVLDAASLKRDGAKVVDIRAALIQKLNTKLGLVSEQHFQTFTAANAYFETQERINKFVLELMEPDNFTDFINTTETSCKAHFKVDQAILIVGRKEIDAAQLPHNALLLCSPQSLQEYVRAGAKAHSANIKMRPVARSEFSDIFMNDDVSNGSEAILKLNLSDSNITAALVLITKDADMFTSEQDTNLIEFFRKYYEAHLNNWIED